MQILQCVHDLTKEEKNYSSIQTPEKGGREIRLESPTGVNAVLFQSDWDKATMKDDEDNGEEYCDDEEFSETDDEIDGNRT